MASDSIRALRVKTFHAADGRSGFARKRFDKLAMSVSPNYIAGDDAWPYLYGAVIIDSSLNEVIGSALHCNVGDIVLGYLRYLISHHRLLGKQFSSASHSNNLR